MTLPSTSHDLERLGLATRRGGSAILNDPVPIGASRLDETSSLPEADRIHREQFARFVLDNAEPWYRRHLGQFYFIFPRWNARFFTNRLCPPYITFSTPSNPQALAETRHTSSFGGRTEIAIRPSLVKGTHRLINPSAPYKGLWRFLVDVFLHEAVHQYQLEVIGDPEQSYRGHGPKFRGECNRIGELLGLPPVRTGKRRGADAHLPSCAYWPLNVRPPGYYLGAIVTDFETTLDWTASASRADSQTGLKLHIERAVSLIDLARASREHDEPAAEDLLLAARRELLEALTILSRRKEGSQMPDD